MTDAAPSPAPPPVKHKSGWLNLAVDYGPVLVFFLVYKHFTPAERGNSVGEVLAVIKGTGSFMVAAVIALVVSKWKLGRVSPMLWLSTALIVGFGGLTILLHDPVWIQRKPTAIYVMFGLALLIGVWRGRPLLKILLDAAFEGLDDAGWMILSRNWGWFFLVMAATNEILRHSLDFGTWIAAKLYAFLPASFLFTMAHMPMLLRHGLGGDDKAEAATTTPHE